MEKLALKVWDDSCCFVVSAKNEKLIIASIQEGLVHDNSAHYREFFQEDLSLDEVIEFLSGHRQLGHPAVDTLCAALVSRL